MAFRHRVKLAFICLLAIVRVCGSSGESRRVTVAHLMTFTEDGGNVFTVLSSAAPLELSCFSDTTTTYL
jgi:hypothetical protein